MVSKRSLTMLMFLSLGCSYIAMAQTINDKYPGLASSSLTYAEDVNLPDGILLKTDKLQITAKDLQQDTNAVPENIREQLKKNAFFHLEQVATKKLLLAAAKDSNEVLGKTDDEIISKYLSKVAGGVTVSDAEITQFYEANKDMCGGATLGQVKEQLQEYVLQQKQQEVIEKYIKTLGKQMRIELSSAWVKEQAKSAKNNPVDKARSSGLASLVDFGASGCRPCDMMTPVLANLKKKFDGKLNVLFIHVREEQILASRYGIQSIPVQVFFDKTGKEVFRHTGFFAQAEIEKQLETVGVK